jgi:hypothetical protein
VETQLEQTDNSASNFPQIRSECGLNQDPATGRFLPGNLANPGGRPKTRSIREAMLERLQDGGAEAVAAVPFEIALGKDGQQSKAKPSERLAAAEMIRDTVEGKPVQSHRIEAGLDESTGRRIVELLSGLAASYTLPVVIDGDTETHPMLPALEDESDK